LAAAPVSSIVAAVLGVPESEVGGETGPATHGEWTSLRHLQIANDVQREYAITLTAREIRSIRTVSDLRELVARKQDGQRTAAQ
jgi:acyl carrier protein